MSKKKEMVNHPEHYGGDTPYEVIKVMKAWHSPEEVRAFCKLTAERYVARAGKKDPEKHDEDIRKAIWYLTEMVGDPHA